MRHLISALTLSACLLLAAPAGAVVPPNFVGLVSEDVLGGDAGYRDRTLGLQHNIGVGLLRQGFDWAEIEKSPGQYDFSFYDEYVAAAARHGIEILPILFHPPAFDSSAPSSGARPGTYPPRQPGELGAFGVALARRYGPNGSLWQERPNAPRLPIHSYQIWNEPNLKAYWPTGPNPRRYAKLLRVASKAIKAVDPRANIVTGGIPDSKISKPFSYLRYIRRMYKAKAKRGFDTLAVNPYADNAHALKRKLKRVRRVMKHYRDPRAKIWLTEIGWADSGPPARFNVGPERQAQNIANSFKLLGKVRRRLRIRGVVYFAWKDSRPYAPRYRDFWGLHTGLLDVNGRAKPAFSGFRDAVAALRAPP
jgi:polysaccharide biosynthesis protein PslG